jgi:hypothetical protein
LTGAGVLAAILISALSGTPDPLPGIALGSAPLFYFERAVAVMAATAVGTMLLVRGLKSETPSQASPTGLGYPAKVQEAVEGSGAVLDKLTSRVDKLDVDLAKHEEALKLLHEAVKLLSEPASEKKP